MDYTITKLNDAEAQITFTDGQVVVTDMDKLIYEVYCLNGSIISNNTATDKFVAINKENNAIMQGNIDILNDKILKVQALGLTVTLPNPVVKY